MYKGCIQLLTYFHIENIYYQNLNNFREPQRSVTAHIILIHHVKMYCQFLNSTLLVHASRHVFFFKFQTKKDLILKVNEPNS